jgi:mannose-6-phosphate isomerase-like protein (cupin superfamily)
MGDYTLKTLAQMASRHHGAVKLVGAELGIESFGVQVLDLPGGFADYPEHDHRAEGMEEVFLVLSGSAVFELDGEPVALHSERFLYVRPSVWRRLVPGAGGVRMLAVGSVPGGGYQRPEQFSIAAANEEARR